MVAESGPSVFFDAPTPRVLAHRGLAVDAPENTLLAFARAVALGVTHIETDVHVSADGVAIVSHDADLTRVAGRDATVAQLTAAELAEVPLGEGQGFVTLAEALDAFPDTCFNIDIKTAGAALPAAAAIRDLRATRRVLVSSFSESRRRAAVDALPGVATSLSASRAIPAVLAARAGAIAPLRGILGGVDAVQFPLRMAGIPAITSRSVESFHSAGIEVHVWTINDAPTMVRLLEIGVDGLVSDRSDTALAVVRERVS